MSFVLTDESGNTIFSVNMNKVTEEAVKKLGLQKDAAIETA